MLKVKVCMLGAFAVGKTSLVQRYVHSLFSEKYQTTLGVKIDKKSMSLKGQNIELILWDLAGEDEFMSVRSSYLRGSSGFILVADGTRLDTLTTAQQLKNRVDSEVGLLPSILLVNKCDLTAQWSIDEHVLDELRSEGWKVLKTSAKNSDNVDLAFRELTTQMLETM